jgi:NitT/TauT family transport system substrate-binding protein
MHDVKRRQLLQAAAAQGLTLGVAGAAISMSSPALAQPMASLKWANLTPGFTILITEYVMAKGLDKKFGLDLGKPTSYTAVSTYYNDFVAGNFDVCMGSWDTFAARYMTGVPMQLVCAITTGNMINILTPKDGPKTIKEMEGKIFAAPQSTGTYRMTRALIKELQGFDIEAQTKIQNVDNPAAAVTLVMANRAEAGLSWEPNISAALKRVPDMRVLYNAGEEYKKKTGLDLPFFGVAVKKDMLAKDPSLARKIDDMFRECIRGITGNVDEAVKIGGSKSGIPADVLATAISSGRLQLKHISMSDEAGRNSVRTAAEFLARNKALPRTVDDGFFAS